MEPQLDYSHAKEAFYFSFHTRAIWILRDSLSALHAEYKKEKEHIIAELCVDLIDRYGWRLANIHIGELVPVVAQAGWSYPEVDVLLTDGTGRPCTLIKVSPRAIYETDLAEAVQELFLLAHALRLERSGSPLSLVYCTRWHDEDHSIKESVITIDYARFKTASSWEDAGRPSASAFPQHTPQSEEGIL